MEDELKKTESTLRPLYKELTDADDKIGEVEGKIHSIKVRFGVRFVVAGCDPSFFSGQNSTERHAVTAAAAHGCVQVNNRSLMYRSQRVLNFI